MFRVYIVLVFLLASVLAAPSAKNSRLFTVNKEWNLVPTLNGPPIMMSRDEILNLERARDFVPLEEINFNLHTRANPNGINVPIYDSAALIAAGLNPGNPTRFLIHGWFNSATSGDIILITAAYLQHGEYNVFVVDWPTGAAVEWVTARENAILAAPVVAAYVDFVVNNSVSLHDIYIIGHSLGAQLAGLTAKKVSGGRVRAIVATDPAAYLFDYEVPEERLAIGDADYVESIFTALVVYDEPIADGEFFPNGGLIQPGCNGIEDILCNHARSWHFFAESINSEIGFYSKRCNSTVAEMTENICHETGYVTRMGGQPLELKMASGRYWLETNPESPFAMGP